MLREGSRGGSIYRYISANSRTVNAFPRELYAFFWFPMLMVRFPTCRPRDVYLFDCTFVQISDNPYTMLLLLAKLPRGFKLEDSMPVEAYTVPPSKCESVSIPSNLISIAGDVIRDDYSRLEQLVDKIYEFKDVEVRYRDFFFRSRRFRISAERIRDSHIKIARSVVKRAVEHFCCIEKGNVRMVEVEAQPVYTLAYISKDFAESGFVVGKKVLRVSSLARLAKAFGLNVGGLT